MASIRKHRDKWQAQIRLHGIKPIAKSFVKKSDAVSWARVIESRVTLGTYADPRVAENTLVKDLIDRYLEQPNQRNRVDASLKSRCNRLRRSLGAFSLSKLSVLHLSEYRDQRLEVVSSQTVIHELSLLRAIFRLAAHDWGIPFPLGIPTIRLPKTPRGRTRRLVEGEEEALLSLCEDDTVLRNFILLALETAMRRSELINLCWEDIDLNSRTLSIHKTKNGIPRQIPLSDKAVEILQRLVDDRVTKAEQSDDTSRLVFSLSATAISHRFARLREKAGITNLRVHDLRHESISRLFELGFNQMEVAAISGHQTVAMLQRYCHLSIGHLSSKLAEVSNPDYRALTR
jgi:integrase